MSPALFPRLYLVRHGAAREAAGRVVGWHDLPLAEAGRRAVEDLAATWRGPPPGRLVTSDLARAADTADLLARRLGVGAVHDRRLRELSFGDWEGRTWDEVHATDRQALADWGGNWRRAAPPGGESFAAVTRRVLAWYEEERCRLRAAGGATVAVGHAGSFCALLAALFGLDEDRTWHLPLSTARASALAPLSRPPVLLWIDRPGFAGPEDAGNLDPSR